MTEVDVEERVQSVTGLDLPLNFNYLSLFILYLIRSKPIELKASFTRVTWSRKTIKQ